MRRSFVLVVIVLLAGVAFAGCTRAPDVERPSDGGGVATRARLTATPLAPSVGQPVTVEASPLAADESVAWNFGDGATATGPRATHTYSVAGRYMALMSVTNGAGRTSTNDDSLTYLTVSPAPLGLDDITERTGPVAVAASSAQVVKVGGTVEFDARGSGGWIANPEYDPVDPVRTPLHNPPYRLSAEGVSFTWSFGDGQQESNLTIRHDFDTPGTFPVKLTVADAAGRTAGYVITVRVLASLPAAEAVRSPTVLTTATIGEPESLDPAYDYEPSGGQIIQHVYETLYAYERESTVQLEPRLASAMPIYSADRAQITIPIRQGVTFHNGDPLDAADVKFSLDRLILMGDPAGPSWIHRPIAGAAAYAASGMSAEDRAAYLAAGGVTAVDAQTIRVTLEHPDPAFLFRLAAPGASIVSQQGVCEHAEPVFVDCLPPPGQTRHSWMDTHEVGSGPFEMAAWIPGQQIVLARFDSYWGARPALEKVIVQKVEDLSTRLLMLASGQADDVYVAIDHGADVLGKPNVVVRENPSWSVNFLGFNQKFCGGPDAQTFRSCMEVHGADAPRGADGKPDPLFFDDINMRKAWAYAFDHEAYFNDILKGHGRRLNGPLPDGMFGFDASIPAPKRDMAKAREAFAQTAHKDGFSVTILYNAGNEVRQKTAELLAKDLRELGPNVDVDVSALDWSTQFLPKQRALALPVHFLGWAPDYAFPDNHLVTFAHSASGVYAKRVGYQDAELDAKLDALLVETDEARLKRGYSDVVKDLNAEQVFVWLAQGSNFHVERDWVQGHYYHPMHAGGPTIGDYTAITKRQV